MAGEMTRNRREEKPNYRIMFSRDVERNDVRLLNGCFSGKWLRELWAESREAKDYIYKYISTDLDPFLQSILKSLLC